MTKNKGGRMMAFRPAQNGRTCRQTGFVRSAVPAKKTSSWRTSEVKAHRSFGSPRPPRRLLGLSGGVDAQAGRVSFASWQLEPDK